MSERDQLETAAAPRGTRGGQRMVAAPAPHAGIGKALRHSFAAGAKLPDDLDRLLGTLR